MCVPIPNPPTLSSLSCFSGPLSLQEKQEENELRALPPPSAAQLRAVDAAVLEAARVQGISEEDYEQRQAVVSRMEETIQQHLSGEMNVPGEGGGGGGSSHCWLPLYCPFCRPSAQLGAS